MIPRRAVLVQAPFALTAPLLAAYPALARQLSQGEPELAALVAEQKSIEDELDTTRWGDVEDPRRLHLEQRLEEVDAAIMSTQARTPLGALWKLDQVLAYLERSDSFSDFDRLMMRSAMADLRRLVLIQNG